MGFTAQSPTFYGTETFHENPDSPGEYVIQKTFDREPIIERATRIRNEVDQRGKELRLQMTIPAVLYEEWIRNGKLGPDDHSWLPNGGLFVNPKKLAALRQEYSALNCDDSGSKYI
jgi:hypothetical protein